MNADSGFGYMEVKAHKEGEDPREIYADTSYDWS
jgi:hypothetical protein